MDEHRPHPIGVSGLGPTADGESLLVSGQRLHSLSINADSDRTPLVFLHEGLGSVELWREFPAEVASRSGHPALLYSRLGYGRSDPFFQPRRVDYLHTEALDTLPLVVQRLGNRAPILIGHSDGASISIIYAGAGYPVTALVLLSPHVFVEDAGLESIRALHLSFPSSDLAEKMAKYHRDPESTFRGWAEVWLNPEFRSWNIEDRLSEVSCPILLIQCEDDDYGSLHQLDAIQSQARGPVQRLVLDGPGHAPHLAHPEAVTAAIVAFIQALPGSPPAA
jgi:pimeloyl-ACP methyl ester carboxylesterase